MANVIKLPNSALKNCKPEEVENERVDDPKWKRVLLVDQNSQEQRIGAAVVHFRDSQHRRRRVQHRNRTLGQHGSDDGCLTKTAGPRLKYEQLD